MTPRARFRPVRRLAGALGAWALLACGGDGAAAPDPSVLPDETFITAYVELRAAALAQPDRTLLDEDRARVLREQGVTEDELLAFVETHGDDVEYMRAIWDEIERRLDARRHVPEDRR